MQCEETGRGREGNYRNCNELGGKGRRPGTVTKMYAKDFLLRLSRERGVVLSFLAHIYSRRHELLLQDGEAPTSRAKHLARSEGRTRSASRGFSLWEK